MTKKTAGRPKGDPTKVIRVPTSKIKTVAKMLGYDVALNQDARINVTLTTDEAVKASKAIGRKLNAAPFVFVRVPIKDLDKIRKAMKK